MLGGVLLVTLIYFAVADFLYVGRLAAYVAILELPEPLVSTEIAPPNRGSLDPAIDTSELILSDVPASS